VSVEVMHPPQIRLIQSTTVLLELTAVGASLNSVQFCSNLNTIFKIHVNITQQYTAGLLMKCSRPSYKHFECIDHVSYVHHIT
jgi:hypothetical protein